MSKKAKTWASLKDNKCPKCKGELQKDMLGLSLVGCPCGFLLHENTKNLLVERDHNDN